MSDPSERVDQRPPIAPFSPETRRLLEQVLSKIDEGDLLVVFHVERGVSGQHVDTRVAGILNSSNDDEPYKVYGEGVDAAAALRQMLDRSFVAAKGEPVRGKVYPTDSLDALVFGGPSVYIRREGNQVRLDAGGLHAQADSIEEAVGKVYREGRERSAFDRRSWDEMPVPDPA